jgi:hypothetical protein
MVKPSRLPIFPSVGSDQGSANVKGRARWNLSARAGQLAHSKSGYSEEECIRWPD